MHPPIGIDLGTSTSIISYYVDDKPVPIPDPATKSPIVPSVVGLSMSGKDILVGQLALDQSRPDQRLLETKRGTGRDVRYRLGDHEYTSEDVAAMILRYLKRNAETHLGQPIRDVVISVPANYEDVRRRAVMEAARMADLNVVRLINEPTAAALAYGIRALDAEELLLVYDFGGGTLDVTVLEMIQGALDVKTSHGVAELGGKDLDTILVEWAQAEFLRANPGAVCGQRSLDRLKPRAEAAKKTLSTYETASIILENFAALDGEPVDMDLILTRAKFEELIRPKIQESLIAVDEALKKAGLNRSDISKVLLVGGTTWIPAVRKAVLDHIGRPGVSGTDPDLAVSLGACISAALAAGVVDTSKSIVVQDVCTYGLGTIVVKDVGGVFALGYEELMEPNTPIPYTVTKTGYRLLRPDQDSIELEIVQDLRRNGRKAVLADETVPTGCSGTLTGIPPSLSGEPHEVTLDFSYDANGIVQLRAFLPALGDKELVLVHKTAAGTPPGSLDIGSLDDAWQRSPLAEQYATWIRQAHRRLEGSPHNRAQLEEALVDLKTKISMGDATAAEAACDRLIDLLTEV